MINKDTFEMKKICFAIPVHEKREIIEELLKNIHFFCPNASIVLFQSGNDPMLCDGLGYPVCPSSHPLETGRTLPWFFLNIMEWLTAIDYQYDYLINVDSDALFIKKGFEELIISEMQETDYMATHLRVPEPTWYPGQTLQKVWPFWQPLLNSEHFLACFMCVQVFSKQFVNKILNHPKLQEIKNMLKQTQNQVFAFEEILFPTLADTMGLRFKPYPAEIAKWVRWRPYYTEEDIINALNNKNCFLVHPIKRDSEDPARNYLKKLF